MNVKTFQWDIYVLEISIVCYCCSLACSRDSTALFFLSYFRSKNIICNCMRILKIHKVLRRNSSLRSNPLNEVQNKQRTHRIHFVLASGTSHSRRPHFLESHFPHRSASVSLLAVCLRLPCRCLPVGRACFSDDVVCPCVRPNERE